MQLQIRRFFFVLILVFILIIVKRLKYISQEDKEKIRTHDTDDKDNNANTDALHWLRCEPRRMELRNKKPFNLTLDYNVSKFAVAGTESTPCRRFLSFNDSCLTYNELVLKAKLVSSGLRYSENYLLYPQDVPMQNVFEAVLQAKPIREAPAFNDHILLLNVSTRICTFSASGSPNEKYDVVIVVKTAPYSFKARQTFRQMIRQQLSVPTGFHFGLLFSLGLPRRYGANRFIRSGVPYHMDNKLGDKMIANDGKFTHILSKISEEIQKFDDIILGDYEDTYFNLSLKTTFNYRFASAFCVHSTPIFLFIDHNHGVNLASLHAHLKSYSIVIRRRLFQGIVKRNDKTCRDPNSKNFLEKEDVPWDVQAPYCHGFAMLVGADLVPQIAVASAFTKGLRHAEDVFVGLMANKLDISMESMPNVYSQTSSSHDSDAIISIITDFVA